MSYRLLVFPLRVPSGFQATRKSVKRGREQECLNNPGRYYSRGEWWSAERPILWDSFSEPRGEYIHGAMDIMCTEGTPVVSTTDGQVETTWTYRGEARPGAGISEHGGHYVWIEDPQGYRHYYAHMSRLFVRPGERVRAGQLIGLCSNQGRASCSHLHYGMTDANRRQLNHFEQLKTLYDQDGWKGAPLFGWPPSRKATWWIIGLLAAAGVFVAGAYVWSRRKRIRRNRVRRNPWPPPPTNPRFHWHWARRLFPPGTPVRFEDDYSVRDDRLNRVFTVPAGAKGIVVKTRSTGWGGLRGEWRRYILVDLGPVIPGLSPGWLYDLEQRGLRVRVPLDFVVRGGLEPLASSWPPATGKPLRRYQLPYGQRARMKPNIPIDQLIVPAPAPDEPATKWARWLKVTYAPGTPVKVVKNKWFYQPIYGHTPGTSGYIESKLFSNQVPIGARGVTVSPPPASRGALRPGVLLVPIYFQITDARDLSGLRLDHLIGMVLETDDAEDHLEPLEDNWAKRAGRPAARYALPYTQRARMRPNIGKVVGTIAPAAKVREAALVLARYGQAMVGGSPTRIEERRRQAARLTPEMVAEVLEQLARNTREGTIDYEIASLILNGIQGYVIHHPRTRVAEVWDLMPESQIAPVLAVAYDAFRKRGYKHRELAK